MNVLKGSALKLMFSLGATSSLQVAMKLTQWINTGIRLIYFMMLEELIMCGSQLYNTRHELYISCCSTNKECL